MPLLIEKMLVANTSHITLADVNVVDPGAHRWPDEAPAWVNDMGRGEGWLIGIVLGNADDAYPQRDFSLLPWNLQALLNLAVKHDCCWLRLDPDGPVIESLPVFDW